MILIRKQEIRHMFHHVEELKIYEKSVKKINDEKI